MSRNIRSGRGVVALDTISYSLSQSQPQQQHLHNYNQLPCCSPPQHHNHQHSLPNTSNHVPHQPLFPLNPPNSHSPPCTACSHCDVELYDPKRKVPFFRNSPSPDQLQRRHTVANYNSSSSQPRHIPHQPHSYPQKLAQNNFSREQILSPVGFWCSDCDHQDLGPPCSCASPDEVVREPSLRYSGSFQNNLQHQQHHPILHQYDDKNPTDDNVPYPNMPRATSDCTVSYFIFIF